MYPRGSPKNGQRCAAFYFSCAQSPKLRSESFSTAYREADCRRGDKDCVKSPLTTEDKLDYLTFAELSDALVSELKSIHREDLLRGSKSQGFICCLPRGVQESIRPDCRDVSQGRIVRSLG